MTMKKINLIILAAKYQTKHFFFCGSRLALFLRDARNE